MKAFSIVGALVSVAVVAAQQPSPAEILRAAPKKFSVQDIPEGYRPVSLGGDNLSMMTLFGFASMGRGGSEGLFFRLFNATWVDPDEFQAALEGKMPRIRTLTLDISGMMQPGGGGEMPTPVFRESWLEANRITSWSPIGDLTKAELLKAFGPGDPKTSSSDQTAALSQVKQIALGVMLYASDYDDVLPKTNATAQTANAVAPYLKNNSLWTTKNPAGGRILYNVSLSAKPVVSFESPAETILLWEEHPWPDGTRAVGYLDGHAKRLNEAQWQKLWQKEMQRRQMAQAIGPATAIAMPAPPLKKP